MIQNICQNKPKVFFLPELSRRMDDTMKEINLAESEQKCEKVKGAENNLKAV